MLVIIVLGVRFVMRRAGSGTRAGQALNSVSPAAATAISALGSALGVAGLARVAAGELGSGSGGAMSAATPARRALPPAVDAICALDQDLKLRAFCSAPR